MIYQVVSSLNYREQSIPSHQRIPFGWGVAPVGLDEDGLLLNWDVLPVAEESRLRFSVSMDQRETKSIEVSLAQSREVLGYMEVAFAYSGQPFEFVLKPDWLEKIAEEGLRLRTVKGSYPLWVFTKDLPAIEGNHYLKPHILSLSEKKPHGTWEDACRYLCSLGSMQPFGWLEGCVLEGLTQIDQHSPAWKESARKTIETHLDLFFPHDQMIYENPHGKPINDRFVSIEGTLMVPALYRYRPEHIGVDWALQYWKDQMHENGIIGGPGYQKCEACYTVAYPLALLSKGRNEDQGIEEALKQLVLQHQCLVKDGVINQAYFQGEYTFPNWARGIGWYLLGIGRTLQITGIDYNDNAKAMAEALSVACEWMLKYQREDGLWNCYVDVPESGVETSGSAGIGAGLLVARNIGCLSEDALPAIVRCRDALESWLSPDGMLFGVSQSNKKEAGDTMQKNGYRCYSQMGLGLAVQLVAELGGAVS